MSLTAAEIAAVVAELAPLSGGVVQAVHAPEPRTLVLRLRVPGRSFRLLVSAEPDASRLHLVDHRPRGGPAPFQGAARHALLGSRLVAIAATPNDRAVRMDLEGGAGRFALVAELTGRHGNLFLLDEADVVRASAVPNLSERRENLPGHAYLPLLPRAEGDAGRMLLVPDGEGPFALNRAAAAREMPRAEARRLETRRAEVLRPLRTATKRIARTRAKIAADLERLGDAERDRRFGELLKPEIHRIARGQRSVTVTDWFDPAAPKVEIPLDPALTPAQNLERYFHRARRRAAAPARVAKRRAELDHEAARVEALVREVRAAGDMDALEAAAEKARAARLGPRAPGARKRDAAPRLPYRRFESRAGRPILVGRGARDNHALTFEVARGNDLWLHARGHTGAHVVVPTGGRAETDPETLVDAAHLAAHFSSARGETDVEIAWTQRKHVRHPKGAAAGLVTTANERVLLLHLEPERLSRLLESERAP